MTDACISIRPCRRAPWHNCHVKALKDFRCCWFTSYVNPCCGGPVAYKRKTHADHNHLCWLLFTSIPYIILVCAASGLPSNTSTVKMLSRWLVAGLSVAIIFFYLIVSALCSWICLLISSSDFLSGLIVSTIVLLISFCSWEEPKLQCECNSYLETSMDHFCSWDLQVLEHFMCWNT